MPDETTEILLIEDSADDAAFFAHTFEKVNLPARLHVVADGAEALEFISCEGRYAGRNPAQPPKVIFLDLKLPKVDGLQVLRRLKSDPRVWSIPVVVLTSSQEERDLVASYKLGVNSYVVKPMDFEQFAETVRVLVQVLAPTQPNAEALAFHLMALPLNILLVEDSQDDAELLVHEMRRAGYDVKWTRVETEPDYLRQLESQPELILSDYSMPQFSGLRAAKLLRERGLDIPFILVSGTVGEEAAVEAMKHGATDYLLKDRIGRLGSAVERALEQQRLRLEGKRMQEQLVLQATALETAANAILITDRRGTILWVNHAFCDLTGYSFEEIVGKTPSVLKSGRHDRTYYHNLWDTILSGQTWRSEIVNRRKDGTLGYDDHTITPVRSEAGTISHFVGVMNDITARKRADEELRESERRFRELLENVELIAMTIDTNGVVTFCNDYLLQLTGWSREEIIGKDWFANFVPESEPHVRKLFFDTIDAGKFPVHYENPIKTRKGELRQIRWNNTTLRDAAGKIIGTASIGEDITERKRTEDALRESEARFRQLTENINEVFWIIDPAENHMLYVSPAYETIWGRTCASVFESARAWLDAIHPDDRQRVREAALAKQVRGDYDETYRITRPDGSLRWIRDRAFPLRNPAGEVYRIVGTAVDVTEQRNLEAQLRQAQKMEAIGQLAGGVAHDFNNLLAIIRGNAELALMGDEPLGAQAGEHVKQVIAASERAAGLTRQLLAFGRKQVMQLQPLKLSDVIGNLTKMLNRIIGEHIRLQCSYGAQLPAVQADPGMMEQVLVNLVVNARDAMPNGGQLFITTEKISFDAGNPPPHPEARPGEFVALGVTDTGTGIAPEHLSRIFEPFFTTKEVGKGTGLGLATVYGIVKQHQGRIEVSTRPGAGTTFRVFLPAVPASPVAATPEARLDLRGGSERILLVEDDAAVRLLTRRILESAGYRIWEAASGKEALDTWRDRTSEIDLLFSDIVMPDGVTGRELAEHLRAQRPSLKVILTSGYSADVAGMDTEFVARTRSHFLQKPCPSGVIIQTVRKCLDEK